MKGQLTVVRLAMMEPVIREAADGERRESELITAVIELMNFDFAYDDVQDWDTVVTFGASEPPSA